MSRGWPLSWALPLKVKFLVWASAGRTSPVPVRRGSVGGASRWVCGGEGEGELVGLCGDGEGPTAVRAGVGGEWKGRGDALNGIRESVC